MNQNFKNTKVAIDFKKTIAVDFDGVIHKYSKGWQNGKIYDKPVEGAKEALAELVNKGYEIIIFTTREDLQAVEVWLEKHFGQFNDVPDFYKVLKITNRKPAAIAYVDDRGIRFTNWKDILNYF